MVDLFNLEDLTDQSDDKNTFENKIHRALYSEDVHLLDEVFNLRDKPENYEEIVIEKLLDRFSYKVADFLFSKDYINNFCQKLCNNFDIEEKRLKANQVDCFTWLIGNEDAFLNHYNYSLKAGINSKKDKPEVATEYLNNISLAIFNIFKFTKRNDLIIQIFKCLGESQTFKKIIKNSDNDKSDNHNKVIENLSFLFAKLVIYDNEYFKKNKQDVYQLFNALLHTKSNNYVKTLLKDRSNKYIDVDDYESFIIKLLPYTKNKYISELRELLLERYIEYGFFVPKFNINNFMLGESHWKSTPFLSGRLSNFGMDSAEIENKNNLFIYILFTLSCEESKRFDDYFLMSDSFKEAYFEQLIHHPYPLLLNELANCIDVNITTHLFELGINRINKYGNAEIKCLTTDYKEIKTSLLEVLSRSALINYEEDFTKSALKNEIIIKFIIENNILDEFRGFTDKNRNHLSGNFQKRRAYLEDKIKEYMLSQLHSSNKKTSPKKFKI